MTSLRFQLPFGTAALLAAACGAAPPNPPRAERVDSAGVEIVLSRAPVWADGAGWRVDERPILEIGEPDGEPPYLFARVAGAVRLDDGRVVVADGQSNEIRFFDGRGVFLQAVGRTGGGPGEFEYLRGLRRCRPDSLFAFDLSWQLSVFTLDGDFVRRERVNFPGTQSTPYQLACDDAGRFLVTGWGDRSFPPPQGFYRVTTPVALIDGDGTLLHDFGTFPGDERLGSERGSRPHPFGKRVVVSLDGDRAYLGTGDTFEIAVHDIDGRLQRKLRRPGLDLAVTPEHLAAYRDEVLEDVPDESRPALERDLRGMEHPTSFPAYAEFHVDADGNLWVEGFRRPGEPPAAFSVFDRDGEWLGDVTFPAGFAVSEIGPDYILGVHRDELDIERVRLYRLIKTGVRTAG